MENDMGTIEFRTNELLEYTNLIQRMSEVDEKSNLNDPDEILCNIRVESDELMTKLLKVDLEYFAKSLLTYRIPREMALYENFEDVESFLVKLKKLSNKELLNRYVYALIERTLEDDIAVVKQEILDDDYLVDIEFDYAVFEEFIEEFDVLRERLERFFVSYYHKVFLPMKAKIMECSKQAKIELEDEYNNDPESFIRRFILMNPEEFIKNNHYKGSFYSNVAHPKQGGFTMQKDHPETMYINLGSYVIKKIRRENGEEIIKNLGEPTKMEIIKLLSKKEMYASELAGALSLNRATISHHLAQLSKSGVLKYAYVEGNKAYYRVDIKRIEAGFSSFLEQIRSVKKGE